MCYKVQCVEEEYRLQLEYESGVIILCTAETISQFESFGVLKGYLLI